MIKTLRAPLRESNHAYSLAHRVDVKGAAFPATVHNSPSRADATPPTAPSSNRRLISFALNSAKTTRRV
jgi:hypothetical protein